VLLDLVRRKPKTIAQCAHLIQTDRKSTRGTADPNDVVERVLIQGTLVAAPLIAVHAEESNGERWVDDALGEEALIVHERRHHPERSTLRMISEMEARLFGRRRGHSWNTQSGRKNSRLTPSRSAMPFLKLLAIFLVVLVVLMCAATGIYYAIKGTKTTATPVAANALPGSTVPVPLSDTYVDHTTPFDEDGGGNVLFLDRQDVCCFVDDQINGGLNSFVFSQQAPDSGKVHYSYTCTSSADSVTKDKCTTVSTTKDDDGGGNPEFLDRQIVACNEGEEISQFKMVQPDGINAGKIRYDYTCCPTAKKSCQEVTTATTPFGWGPSGVAPPGAAAYGTAKANVRFLDKHNVQCQKGEVLKSFGAIQPGGPDSNTLAYKYTCCS
jgi:hypothetical protein